MSRRTVLVLASYPASLIRFRGHLLQTLVRRGHDVHVSAPSFSIEESATLAGMGVTVHDVPLQRTGTNPARDLAYVASIARLCAHVRASVCLAYTIKPVALGLLGAAIGGVKNRFALITGLGFALDEDASGHRITRLLARFLYRTGLRGAKHVFFQNPDDRALFERRRLLPRDGSVSVVNGSGVDLAYYGPVPANARPVSFLLIARLLVDKGVREYVSAARALRSRYPEAVFRLAGWIDTNPRAISELELDAWKREGVIEYLGVLNDVREAIAACTVFVLPSYREGTPRTVLEAMSMGRAIITTDAPGCRETVVAGENGTLVPPGDAAALTKAMQGFLDDPSAALRMGQRSREIAQIKYDVQAVNEGIIRTMGL